MDQQTIESGGIGYLVVQVSTANTAIPLPGASVSISADGGESEGSDNGIIFELVSGPDGRSARVSLPTAPRADSQKPGAVRPYFTYSIRVSLPGFDTGVYRHVPIFDGVTSLTQADLIPLPDNGRTDGSALGAPRDYTCINPDL